MAVAILAFCLLRTVVEAWYIGVSAASPDRLITRNAVSLIFPLPLAYRQKILQVAGVRKVGYGNWFAGVYIDEKNFFPSFAIGPIITSILPGIHHPARPARF
jgi:putative ABC transport system permease protein